MVTIQQQAKEGVQWMADTIEQLQKERDYLDARCAELEKEKEQVCEWVKLNTYLHGKTTDEILFSNYLPACTGLGIDTEIVLTEIDGGFKYCPNCGKRIEYKDGE